MNPCIYFLLKEKEVVYIGQTTSIRSRLSGHKDKRFDDVRVMYCALDRLNFYEERWINRFKPKYNRTLKVGSGIPRNFRRTVFKTKRVTAILEFDIADMMKSKCENLGMSPSEYLRILILEDCQTKQS